MAKHYSEVDEIWVRGSGWQPAPPPTQAPSGKTGDGFVAHHRLDPSGNVLDSQTWIEIKDEAALKLLKIHFPLQSSLYDRKPGIDSREVFLRRESLRACSLATLKPLIDYVEDRFKIWQEKHDELPKGTVTWNLLWWIMPSGQAVEGHHELFEQTTMAYEVDSWQYTMDDRGRAFVIYAHHYQWSGSSFKRMTVSRKIPEFKGILHVDQLEFWPLTPERQATLAERGRVYVKQEFASMRYAQYEGYFYTRLFTSGSRISGTGRVMVDVMGYRKAHPNFDIWGDDMSRPNDEGLSRNHFHLLPPCIHGFSMKAKRWGEFLIDNISPVIWAEQAFEHLVIPDLYRRTIRSLVDVHTGNLGKGLVNDVISGKGEGLIIALHGPPGTGKTLTAEAVSEHLRKPIYMVSAGELGTSLAALEKKLTEVLELATAWKAILLIDEADIFLEKRANSQIERNAMVGVFLRLLEYYSGVLILTTNRIEEFDEAFSSRFSLTLPFRDLDPSSRSILWTKFIAMCRPGLTSLQLDEEFDFAELSSKVGNGRFIKQTVRTAQAMSLSEGVPLSMDHLRQTLSLSA